MMASFGYIQVTRACNQDCLFCSNPTIRRNIAYTEACRYVDIYCKKKYAGVFLTGGEPTLYPNLAKLISYAAAVNMNPRIITNGQKTADFKYFRSLKESGLCHIMLSLYSNRDRVISFLTQNQLSLINLKKTLENAGKLGVTVDIITVINKYNADHLSEIVRWIASEYPFVKHFIWNNLDPFMNKASRNTDTIPRLNDFYLELFKAMSFLNNNGMSFRVERVPLCYMPEFEHCSTETRKIVKGEERAIFFLDNKGYVMQKGRRGFVGYSKTECCNICSFNDICVGLYAGGDYYVFSELYPVFVSKEEVKNRILNI